MIYTSGSTGRPKGVMIERKGMNNHLRAKIEELGLTREDVIAQTAAVSFDISVWQLLSGLMVGARVEIVEDETAHDPWRLAEEVGRRGISVLETVPAILRGVVNRMEEGEGRAIRRLRWMLVTGEAFEVELSRRWMRVSGGVKTINAYGPTECSDDVTQYELEGVAREGEVRVPIGRALSNTQICYLVTEGDLRVGELRKALKEKLPEYMVPTVYRKLEAMPLTRHGKIDKAALPWPVTEERVEQEYQAAETKTEAGLARIWEEVRWPKASRRKRRQEKR